ncbi:beta-alanyl-dopamine/carcinine hydrolase [Polyergus mexicanus]|uniref:beta-alanyl-dopamine/carcinine hydrolase n=1 Tax=Polyergus mexicanus TaxID=615972 RepID=UPI0038B57851
MTTIESCEIKSISKSISRRNAVPIIHVRGTHYEIGFDIGRTFAKMIQDFVDIYSPLNETYLPLFATEKGKNVYEETLGAVKKQFPQYVREIEGTADGANIPFYKLFLMHLDDIISNVTVEIQGNSLPVGCSTIICNQPGSEILGHNEDALKETLNHWYLVSAHVIEAGHREEKFTSLSYAGFLPGYTMGYNHHGLVYSINTLSAAVLRSGKTPRYFLTRALLGVENFVQAQQTLRNEGCGAAEGFSVNMTFLAQEGDRMFHNAEVGPAEADTARSQLNILTVSPGENTSHCNKYLRLKVAEVEGMIIQSSIKRMEAIFKHPPAECRQNVIDILSDQTDDEFRVYQEIGNDDHIKTIATGIFDCIERTWSIYTDKPQCNEPILVIPMQLRDFAGSRCNNVKE